MTDTKNVISIIMPGRRALGETWSRVNIGHTRDEIVVTREDAQAPADGKPFMAVTGPDAVYSEYIIEAMYEKAKNRPPSDPLSEKERWEVVNEAWFNFMEQKIKYLSGSSQIGPTGLHQRQRVNQNPATRPSL